MNTLQVLLVVAIASFIVACVCANQVFKSSIASGHGNSTVWGALTFIFYGTAIVSGITMAFVGLGI